MAKASKKAGSPMNGPDLAYKTGKWYRKLFADFMEGNEQAQEVEETGTERQPLFRPFMREVFTRLYSQSDPAQVEDVNAEARWAQTAHDEAGNLHEWKSLRNRSRGDEVWSGVSAAVLSDKIVQTLPEAPPEANEDLDKLRNMIEGLQQMIDHMKASPDAGTEQGQAAIQKAQNQQGQATQKLEAAEAALAQYAENLDPSQMRQAIRSGAKAAHENLDEYEAAMDAFGWGTGPSNPRLSSPDKLKAWKAIRDNQKLAQIAAHAGRLKRIAERKRRTRTNDQPSEVVGVRKGDDLNWLLDDERARGYAGGQHTQEFLADLEDRATVQFNLRGNERCGRGPIVFALDESGSMDGDKEVWSKAVALALMEYARREKRTFALVHFASSVARVDIFPAHEQPTMEKVMEALLYFANGGTMIQAALEKALQIIDSEKGMDKADIITISDGIDGSLRSYADRFKEECEKRGVATYGLLIGAPGSDGGIMESAGMDVTPFTDVLQAQAKEEGIGDKLFTL